MMINRSIVWALGILFGLGAATLGQAQSNAAQPAAKGPARMIRSLALPKLDGAHLKASLVEVRYAPGESSPPHSHPCAVIVYVVEGAVRTQVKGEAEATYKAGDTFYEAPNGAHVVSANASKTEPAKFVAYFVCDKEVPLTGPVHQTH